ncbi:MAG: hypothetical protein AB1918_01180 [Pseudomonadota bacterium]
MTAVGIGPRNTGAPGTTAIIAWQPIHQQQECASAAAARPSSLEEQTAATPKELIEGADGNGSGSPKDSENSISHASTPPAPRRIPLNIPFGIPHSPG